jgi:single-stranded DNA-binding protein
MKGFEMSRAIEIATWAAVIKDGELKTSAAGNSYATVLLGADSGHTDDRGQPVMAFMRVIAFKGLATVAANLRKGGRCYLEGTLSVGIWQPEGAPAKPDLSVKAFRLEPTSIGKSRPPRGDAGAAFHRLLDGQARQPEFNDEIGF